MKISLSLDLRLFSSLWRQRLSKHRKYYVKLCKSALFVSGLAITQKFINYSVVSVLITFLTDSYSSGEFTIVNSAALTNLGDGISGLALILVTAISASYASHQKIILSSTAVYVTGLVLICLSAYHLIPKAIYYFFMVVAVSMIAVGKSGSKPILDNFFIEQLRFHEKEEEGNEDLDRIKARFNVWRLVAWLLALVPILLTSHFGWQKMLVVSSSLLTASGVWFWFGTLIPNFYHSIEPKVSPPVVVCRVLKAAFLKRKLEYPLVPHPDKFFCPITSTAAPANDHDKFFTNKGNEIFLLPDVRFCRRLDKAAIIESSSSPKEQESKGKLHSITRVEEAKHILRMVPIWIAFLGHGLARATANTFFPEQADNYTLDSRTITITTLLVLDTISEVIVSSICDWISERINNPPKRYLFLKCRICFGILTSTVCFVVAWKIEEMIPSTAWLLAPQFCLSGFAEGLAMDGLANFYDYQVPQSMRGYGDVFNGLVTGFGSLLSIPCLYIFKSATDWFGEDVNSSWLDKYYIFIILVTIVSLLLVGSCLVLFYAFSNVTDETGQAKGDPIILKDTSEQEKRFHEQATETMGIGRKTKEPADQAIDINIDRE